MHVGIYTRYYRHEATYAAMRLAKHAQCRGLEVSMFTDDRPDVGVCKTWDQQVLRHGPGEFTNWAHKQDLILWTHVPPEGQLHWAKKHGKRTVVLALWQELCSLDRKTLRQADVVLCPGPWIAALLRRRWKLEQCVSVHWDVGLPITTRDDTQPLYAPRLLLPTDLLCPKFSPELGAMMLSVLETCPEVSLTISYVPSRWRGWELSLMRSLRSTGRFQMLASIREHDRPLLFQQHDLTLWPCLNDNFAYGALYSLTVGTPVLAMAGPAACGVLENTNSVVVPGDLHTSDLGVPYVVPDYPAYLQYLLNAVSDPHALAEMRTPEPHRLLSRRDAFTAAVDGILQV